MEVPNGFIFAYRLDGKGAGSPVGLEDLTGRVPSRETLWVHLDYDCPWAKKWLDLESGIDPIMLESLTTKETRPRALVINNGLLGILRGVNLNPGAEPEDMVSIRFWMEENRIVTLRHRRVMAIDDLSKAVGAGSGPAGPGEFLEQLADRLVIRMGDAVADVEDEFDALEDEILTKQTYELRPKLAKIRRTVISLRRYLAPQRDVMSRLHSEKIDWLGDLERMRLREIGDRTIRFVEDLDSIRDRATVTQEELNSSLTEQMNKTMYVLSIVAGIFLPLGLLTGLLGVNVGGIPGTESPWAFTVFCLIMVAIASWQVWLFRRKSWI